MIQSHSLSDYDYFLPQELIAEFPLPKRDESRLLVFSPSHPFQHKHFTDLPSLLPAPSLFVLNESRVIPARLHFLKETGGSVEIFCLEPISPSNDPQVTLASPSPITYRVMVGGKKVLKGMRLEHATLDFEAFILEREEKEAVVEFRWKEKKSFSEILDDVGKIPLPPYLKREIELSDLDRYQTVYSKTRGSVAAPTAGLHLTEAIMKNLTEKNHTFSKVTLHVGAGTFRPIEKENIKEHPMHQEKIWVSLATLKAWISFLKKKENDSRFICVGTTSLRTVESLYWMGLKTFRDPSLLLNDLDLEQWEWENLKPFSDRTTRLQSFEALAKKMEIEKAEFLFSQTKLMITPEYTFKVCDALITNFHQPKSTLLLLVSAFIGSENRKQLYDEALREKYRFLSYGDTSLLLR